MSGLEVIRERRKVDRHFRRFGALSKQIFAASCLRMTRAQR